MSWRHVHSGLVEALRSFPDAFRELCFWRPRCGRCGFRRPDFAHGRCFDCAMEDIRERFWTRFEAAVVEGILFEWGPK
jgi:hypothetical protein